jgi:hypothetical protein
MEIKEKTKSPVANGRLGWRQGRSEEIADPVAVRLEIIVGRSRRRGRLRRAQRRIGDALARRIDALVPPAPRASATEPPPEIRFPFF